MESEVPYSLYLFSMFAFYFLCSMR